MNEPRRLTLTLSWLFSLHRQEVSPAPSLPRMLMQPRLPGNRLRGVAQGLTTRSFCDRGRDEGRGSPPDFVCVCVHIYIYEHIYMSVCIHVKYVKLTNMCVCM